MCVIFIKYIDSFDNETSRLEWLDLRGNPAVDEDPEFGKVIEQETEIFYLYVNGLYNDNKKHYKDNYPNIQIIESDNLEDAYKKALYKYLEYLKPDLGISFGTGIIKPYIFNIPKWGTINIHRGCIDSYRGLDSDLWAL